MSHQKDTKIHNPCDDDFSRIGTCGFGDVGHVRAILLDVRLLRSESLGDRRVGKFDTLCDDTHTHMSQAPTPHNSLRQCHYSRTYSEYSRVYICNMHTYFIVHTNLTIHRRFNTTLSPTSSPWSVHNEGQHSRPTSRCVNVRLGVCCSSAANDNNNQHSSL